MNQINKSEWEKRRKAALAVFDSFDWETETKRFKETYRGIFSKALEDNALNAEQRKFWEECLEIVNEPDQ